MSAETGLARPDTITGTSVTRILIHGHCSLGISTNVKYLWLGMLTFEM